MRVTARDAFEFDDAEDSFDVVDDEALARALQEEYESEYRRSREAAIASPSDWRPPPTAPPATPHRSHDPSSSRRNHGERGGDYQNRTGRSSRGERAQPVPVVRVVHNQDQDMAVRLEQLAMDEAYARRIAEYQEQQLSASRAQQLAAMDSRSCSLRRACSCFIGLAIIAASIVAVSYYLLDGENLRNFIPDPEAFREEDPFSNANPDDANRWKNNGKGLSLTVVNALDDDWHSYFNLAVEQWDKGTPDSLTLTTTMSSPDYNCNPVPDVLKVCNGDYGDTNWRGINKILIDNRGWIYASAARMNEHYFKGEGDAQRQYTMCHEIGHGFGLPHTDEDFFNKDMGDCMDYTNRPERNMQPSSANFLFLNQLYGYVPGSPTVAPEATVESSLPGNRNLRQPMPTPLSNRQRHLAAFNKLDIDLNGSALSEQGWKLLHRSDYGEAHEIDLGEGFTAQIHVLRP